MNKFIYDLETKINKKPSKIYYGFIYIGYYFNNFIKKDLILNE
jgi:hypothetical protein